MFLGKTKYKIVPFLFGKFSEMTKKQKIFCKKTPPQGTKSGKSKHKNIDAVNSRIDGLFFVFIFVFAPPHRPNKLAKFIFGLPKKQKNNQLEKPDEEIRPLSLSQVEALCLAHHLLSYLFCFPSRRRSTESR